MTDTEALRQALREALEAARADLLAVLDALPSSAFAAAADGAPGLADVLWELGHNEDRVRRAITAAIEGRAMPDEDLRPRPAYLTTPELLVEWLHQSRRPTIVLLHRLGAEDLERALPLPGSGTSTPRLELEGLAARDREVTAQLQAKEQRA